MKNKKNSFPLKFSLILLLAITANTSIFAQTTIPAPDFTLEDVNGNTVSLSDFKNKTIYIDFWATWCKPCMEEVSHSIKLNNEFKDDTSIVFINISIDSDKDRWKKLVEKKKMLGTQLISLGGIEANIIQNYGVASIPKFVLINKEGEIVDGDALRPSERGLSEYIKKISQ